MDTAVFENNEDLVMYLLSCQLRPSRDCLGQLNPRDHLEVVKILQSKNIRVWLPREHRKPYCDFNSAVNWITKGIYPGRLTHEMDLALGHGQTRLVMLFHRYGIQPSAKGIQKAKQYHRQQALAILSVPK